MNCPSPNCHGVLHTGNSSGFCTTCRLPVSACTLCHAWNRAFALYCRQCGKPGTLWRQTDPVDRNALRGDPRSTTLPQQVITSPQAGSGFLWAMGAAGDLYRLNPYAAAGEQLQVQDRFWAEPQPHGFCISPILLPSAPETPSNTSAAQWCAVVATRERVLVSSLLTRQRISLLPLAGEEFLLEAQESFQTVAAHQNEVFVLSRFAGQIAFCAFDLRGGEPRRFSIGYGDTAFCGPVSLRDGASEHVVFWSARALWLYTAGELQPVALPEAVELWTAPGDSALRLSPGRSPAVTGDGHLYLPARQFGRPALLRLAHNAGGWAATALAITESGTLGETATGDPLLATTDRLLLCTGSALRPLVQDAQIDPRLPAWAGHELAVYFCQTDYGGLKQWLKAYAAGADVPVGWTARAQVQACSGFWAMGTALGSVCVLGEQGLRTEFLAWCV